MLQITDYMPDDDGVIYKGPVTFGELGNDAGLTWMKQGADEYQPKAAAIDTLKTALGNYTLVVFLGTWCGDSRELLPKLQKVLQLAGYPMDKLAMYATDRAKETINGEHKKFAITNVPTVILFDPAGVELGRITERVSKSMEEDLAEIVATQIIPFGH